MNHPETPNNKAFVLYYTLNLYFLFPFLTCLPMIFSSRLFQSIFSSDMGSWMAQRSASSATFFSRSPAWWLRRSISICSWYASPLNSWETRAQRHTGVAAQSIERTIQLVQVRCGHSGPELTHCAAKTKGFSLGSQSFYLQCRSSQPGQLMQRNSWYNM